MESTAGGPSGVAIECLSTRCAALVEGSCHRLACKHMHRWFEPDVIVCKHEKGVECPATVPQ